MRIVLTRVIVVGVASIAALGVAFSAPFTFVIAGATSRVVQGPNTFMARHRVLFNRLAPDMTIFTADADGQHEPPLLATPGLEYSPAYSADGQWVVYTGEHAGQADIYRIHPDGSGLQQLTDDPAFDDPTRLHCGTRIRPEVSKRRKLE